MRARCVLVLVLVAACAACAACAGCTFSQDVPRDAKILCAGDECPAGDVCNPVQGLCVAAGSDVVAPTIVRVAFTPSSIAAGNAQLVITASELLRGATVELAPGSLPIDFGAAAVDDAAPTATFTVDSDALTEATYPVERVTVTDLAGNVGAAAVVNVALVVDRTAPDIVNPRIVDVPPTGLSDVEGTSLVVVELGVTETPPDDGVRVAVAGREAACVVGAGLQARCEVDVAGDSALLNGDNDVVITAVDRAGNPVTRTLQAHIDAAAPFIVGDSATATLSAPGDGAASVATAGGSVVVVFLVSEALVADAVVAIEVDGGAPLAMNVQSAGQHYEATLVVPAGVDEGVYPVVASFADAAGHSVVGAVVALAAPFHDGVPFGAQTSSTCTRSTALCVDADGDGFNAPDGCSGGDDCNDVDPTVFPGGPEIPGDGLDNDCSGDADAPIDDDTGTFVDPAVAAGSGDGTRARPFASIDEALEGAPNKRVLFLAADRDYAFDTCDGSPGFDHSLIGGFVNDGNGGWTKDIDAPRARVTSQTGCTWNLQRRAFVDLSLHGTLSGLGQQVLFVRVDSDEGGISGVVVMVEWDGAVEVFAGGQARVIRSRPSIVTANAGSVFLFRSEVNGSITGDGNGDVVLVSSVLRGDINCAFASSLTIAHSTVISQSSSALMSIGDRHATIAGSSFLKTGDAPFFIGNNGLLLEMNGNNFGRRSADGGALFADVSGTDFARLGDVVCGGCSLAANTAIDPVPFTDDVKLSAQSPLRDQGVTPFVLEMPSSVMIDFGGDCRYDDGSADVGADEFVP